MGSIAGLLVFAFLCGFWIAKLLYADTSGPYLSIVKSWFNINWFYRREAYFLRSALNSAGIPVSITNDADMHLVAGALASLAAGSAARYRAIRA